MANSGIPVFAALVNPALQWTEKYQDTMAGTTTFYKKSARAKMEVPAHVDTPEARHVRIHELLHGRYSHAISALALTTGTSEVAQQASEDIRLAQIGWQYDLFANAFMEVEKIKASSLRRADHDKSAQAMAAYYMCAFNQPFQSRYSDQPPEALRTLDCFEDLTEYAFARIPRRILRAWTSMVVRALGTGDTGPELFQQLKDISEHAIKLLELSPPDAGSGNGNGDEDSQKFQGLLEKVLDRNKYDPVHVNRDLEKIRRDPLDVVAIVNLKLTRSGIKDIDPSKAPFGSRKAARRGKARALELLDKHIREVEQRRDKLIDFINREGTKEALQKARRKRAVTQHKNLAEQAVRIKSSEPPKAAYIRALAPAKRDDDLNFSIDPSAGWGTMETRMLPLERSFRAVTYRRGRACIEGTHPHHFSRWFLDKSIFDRKGLRYGGTLLVDISGSMSWAYEQSMKMIHECPAMTIALYSERTGEVGKGVLTIVARFGRIVSPDHPIRAGDGGIHDCGNIVDGPALAWLARQPGPRVWFSDGKVTGHAGGNDPCGVVNNDIYSDADRICRNGAIVRTQKHGNVLHLLRGRMHAPSGLRKGMQYI